MILALFTTAKCLMQYSNNCNVLCCNDRNALFHYHPTLVYVSVCVYVFCMHVFLFVYACVYVCMCIYVSGVCVGVLVVYHTYMTVYNSHACTLLYVYPCSYSLAKFNEGMRNANNIPRTFDQFEHVTETSTESALKVLIVLSYSSKFCGQIFL